MDGPDLTFSLTPRPLLSNPSKTPFHTASSAVGPHTPVARTAPSSTRRAANATGRPTVRAMADARTSPYAVSVDVCTSSAPLRRSRATISWCRRTRSRSCGA